MSSCEKENVITEVTKQKTNKSYKKSTADAIIRKKESTNVEVLALKTALEEQRAVNIELNEQVEEQVRSVETMKYQFAMLKQLKWRDNQTEGSSSADDRLYGLLNGMRLVDAENEAFNLRKKVEMLKDEFDAIDTIMNEKATAIEENTKLKKEVKSLTEKVNDLSDDNEMLNGELADAESTIEHFQTKVTEMEQKIFNLKNVDEPTSSCDCIPPECNCGHPT